MRLFARDQFEMIARMIPPDEALTVVDVGAHVGATATRVLGLWPRARVHAFEPSPEPAERLREIARSEPRLTAWPNAVGDAEGEIELRVNENSLFTSTRRPTENGRLYYGRWVRECRTVSVPLVRLDAWAEREGIERVDVLKVDVQGAELDVLRGAGRLLDTVRYVVCEAPFVAEYEGSATFSDIDLFLRSRGFGFHQLHEVYSKGPEEQTSVGDALWARNDELARLRADIAASKRRAWAESIERQVDRLESRGRTPLAIFGVGDIADWTLELDPALLRRFSWIIGDHLRAAPGRVHGVPVVTLADAVRLGLRSLIATARTAETWIYGHCGAIDGKPIDYVQIFAWPDPLFEPRAGETPAAEPAEPEEAHP